MIYTSRILTPESYNTYQARLLESERLWVSEREEDKSTDRRRFRSYIRHLKKHVREGKLLDIGCFSGSFLECAKEAGFSPSGVEIHEDKAAIAASKGFPILVGDFEKLDVEEGHQVATWWESLEHTNNPRLVIEKVRSILSQGGLVAFTVPNGDALSVKVLNGHLMWLTGFAHKNMFTPSAVAYLLKECGFEVVELKTRDGPDMRAIISYLGDRINDMDSFQNWGKLEEGIYEPSSARLWQFLVRPIVEYCRLGDLIFCIARKV